jgi:N-methylhydantoinase A
VARDHVVTLRRVDPEPADLAGRFGALTARAYAELRADGVAAKRLLAFRFARVRYAGQSDEIEIPFGRDYRRRFDAAHARLYGHAAPERPVEVLGLRVTVSERGHVAGARPAPKRKRSVPPAARHVLAWRGRRIRVPRYDRDALGPGTRLRGPALLLEYSSTVFVPPGWAATVDAHANLRITR